MGRKQGDHQAPVKINKETGAVRTNQGNPIGCTTQMHKPVTQFAPLA
jgi:hypothetical protein